MEKSIKAWTMKPAIKVRHNDVKKEYEGGSRKEYPIMMEHKKM
jgi:hypothetical protein